MRERSFLLINKIILSYSKISGGILNENGSMECPHKYGRFSFFLNRRGHSALSSHNKCFKIHPGFLIAYLLVMFLFWPIQIIYHRFVIQKKEIETLRRIDRGSMLFLLAAIFSPILVRYGADSVGWVISIILWSLSVIGMMILLSMKELPRILTPIFAFLMGILQVRGFISLESDSSVRDMVIRHRGVFSDCGRHRLFREETGPLSECFGFHELFHTLITIGAIILHFVISAAFLK